MSNKNKPVVLVLGASGLLGSAVFSTLSRRRDFRAIGLIRSEMRSLFFSEEMAANLILMSDVLDSEKFEVIFRKIKPSVVINCTGCKVSLEPNNEAYVFQLLGYFPVFLSELCEKEGVRLIHISSDGVFSGHRGNYTELDIPDAQDVYGRSKIMGERVSKNAVVLRVSVIGHELCKNQSLLEWFLGQRKKCYGYSNYVFSVITAHELACVIEKQIIQNLDLKGIFHVGSEAISKFELLKTVANTYGSPVQISEKQVVPINRTLNVEKFRVKTGYSAPPLAKMLEMTLANHKKFKKLGFIV